MSFPLDSLPASLLCKLGSIAVHVEEGLVPLSPTAAYGHAFDVIAIRQLLADHEVQDWLRSMHGLALLPVKRTDR
jgi:hypothetical protein